MPGTEADWIRKAQKGDSDAFAELVLAHQDFVYNLALRVLNHPQEAEDIAQEAFVRAWQALPRFRGKAKFSTWLYRIVTNLCYNRLPRLKRDFAALGSEEITDMPADDFVTPLAEIVADERLHYLHKQIDQLPETYKLVLTLRFQKELSYAEIAEIVEIPLGTVKTVLFRARERLRAAFHQYEEEPVWTQPLTVTE